MITISIRKKFIPILHIACGVFILGVGLLLPEEGPTPILLGAFFIAWGIWVAHKNKKRRTGPTVQQTWETRQKLKQNLAQMSDQNGEAAQIMRKTIDDLGAAVGKVIGEERYQKLLEAEKDYDHASAQHQLLSKYLKEQK